MRTTPLWAFLTLAACQDLAVVLLVEGEPTVIEGLTATDDGRLSIGKPPLLRALGMQGGNDETVLVFFKADAFTAWTQRVLSVPTGEPWPDRLSVFVDGLDAEVAGPNLRVGAAGCALPSFEAARASFPTEEDYASLVYLSPRLHARRIHQSALTRGDVGSPWFAPLRRWAEYDAALLVANEVTVRDDVVTAILRGSRRVESAVLSQGASPDAPNMAALNALQAAITWIFESNVDTRHALVVDRLALEHASNEPLVALIRRCIGDALWDARERYQIFVLDKNDAATKELCDVLKDVRSQADLYASKSRDLATSSLRDILATFLLIGLGLMGRLDADKLLVLTQPRPIDLFMHLLGGYFVLSGLTQISVQGRDRSLAKAELKRWLQAVRAQLPSQAVTDAGDEGIKPRRNMFIAVCVLIAIVDLALAMCLFGWKSILLSAMAS